MTLQSITGYESVQRYLAMGDIDGGYGPGAAYNCPPQCSPQQRASYIEFPVETSAGLNSHEQLTQEFRVVSKNDGPLQGQAGVFLFYESVTAADDDYCAPGDGALCRCVPQAIYGRCSTPKCRVRKTMRRRFSARWSTP